MKTVQTLDSLASCLCRLSLLSSVGW